MTTAKRTTTPNRVNGRATRQKIVQSAANLLAQHGNSGVTIGAVAAAAGITRRALYHHFANRDALMEAVSTHLEQQLRTATRDSLQVDDPFWLIGASAALNAPLLRAQLVDALGKGYRHSKLVKDVCEQLQTFEKKGLLQPDVDTEMAGLIAFSSLFGALLATDRGNSKKQRLEFGERYILELKRMLEHGLLTPAD